jgi:general L-amino acid transport system substrate-binding protein
MDTCLCVTTRRQAPGALRHVMCHGIPGREYMMRLILMPIFLWLTAVPNPGTALAGPTFDFVRANKVVRCGVSEALPGFSQKDESGHWHGFDMDFCRAVAAAALGKPDQVAFVPVTAATRFPVLLSGKIELLLRNTTYTFEREAALKELAIGTRMADCSGYRHLFRSPHP